MEDMSLSVTLSAVGLVAAAEECEQIAREMTKRAAELREQANRLISNEHFGNNP